MSETEETIVTPGRLFFVAFITCTVAVAVLGRPFVAAASDDAQNEQQNEHEVDLSKLVDLARKGEEKCLTGRFEYTSSNWEGEIGERLLRTDRRRIVQWWEWFYESLWVDDFADQSSGQPIRVVWCDKINTTIQQIPGGITRRRGWKSVIHFQPYAVLLETLGVDGTLSVFLSGDQESLMPLSCEILGIEERDGFDTVIVRAVRQFPGSDFRREIELALLLDYHCLPYWGRCQEVEGEQIQLKKESKVVSLFDFDDDLMLMREIVATSTDDQDGKPHRLTRSIHLEGESERQIPSHNVFASPEFVIRTISNEATSDNYIDGLRGRVDQIPKDARSQRLLQWIAFNFSVLGCIALFLRFIALRKTSLPNSLLKKGGRHLAPLEWPGEN